MIDKVSNPLLSIDIISAFALHLMAACTPSPQKPLDIKPPFTIIGSNNTPPASRLALWLECSAPRGVTLFWGGKK